MIEVGFYFTKDRSIQAPYISKLYDNGDTLYLEYFEVIKSSIDDFFMAKNLPTGSHYYVSLSPKYVKDGRGIEKLKCFDVSVVCRIDRDITA